MYANTGYYNHIDMDIEDLSRPLVVESCGTFRFRTRSFMKTLRPRGRRDYQLIYIAAGRVFFDFDGHTEELGKGHMVLYRPGVPQNYIYYAADQPEVYWLHFTGSEVEQILEQNGIGSDMSVFFSTAAPEYQQLLLQMIRELQLRKPCFEELLVLLFSQLLVLLRRYMQNTPKNGRKIQKEVEQAVHFFNENYYKEININDYASAQHISTCWFIRSFRQSTGMAPMQYITSVRIAKASSLLAGTDYNISEIAAMVGYENPLYFSRIFKKMTGSSPTRYRETL